MPDVIDARGGTPEGPVGRLPAGGAAAAGGVGAAAGEDGAADEGLAETTGDAAAEEELAEDDDAWRATLTWRASRALCALATTTTAESTVKSWSFIFRSCEMLVCEDEKNDSERVARECGRVEERGKDDDENHRDGGEGTRSSWTSCPHVINYANFLSG